LIAFGVRMFNNLAIIRRLLLRRLRGWWERRNAPG
jgi:small basic protein